MPLCLSFFEQFDAEALRNHAFFAQRFGYAHRWTTAERTAPIPELRQFLKYSEILRALRGLPEADLLLFLDGDTLVHQPVSLEVLMQGRDLLVCDGPAIGGHPGRAMTNLLGLRNTAANRELLHALVRDASRVVARVDARLDESARFAPAGLLPCNAMLADRHVNVSWRFARWWSAPAFAVCLAPIPIAGAAGSLATDPLHDTNLQRLLARQVNDALMLNRPLLQPPAYPALSDDAFGTHQPGRPIALLTLYTANIAAYGRVSEHNLRRYCERHGYTHHVHRAIPGDVAPGVNGAWIKSRLLRRHLEQHEWVVWIDADALFVDPARPLGPLLEGRDRLFTKDVGDWALNAGFMAWRNTPRNAGLLDELTARIDAVADKSQVYSSHGDQQLTADLLVRHGLDGEADVIDNLTLNTPPLLAGPETLLVHFMGLGEPYRSVYMAEMDAQSMRA